ncbi:hypothetical protein BUALT_Bualt10G0059400 [Buddleja alternifolia]|uniref:WRKY19-like zinc finger domain-containing protein n=1 Tax=Buddleja alternifolia TaxID=168488 RepID=A0AAV6X4K3_9LAMI|nr:hypothetical protein BUALT_Bualt10G0059400 [Buddleja alternifolia]
MDSRIYFAGNLKSNASKNLCKSSQTGGTGAEVVHCADTTLRLDSPGFANPFTSAPKGVKRKWCSMGGSESSLDLRLGHSSSSSDSKGSTATACTSMSSAKETDEESSMDLELDFTLHLGGDKSCSEKSTSSNLNTPPKVDLQLSLSGGPAVSDVTTGHPSSIALKNVTEMVTGYGVVITDEGSTGSPFLPLPTAWNNVNSYFPNQYLGQFKPTSPVLSSSVITTPKSSVTCTSGITQSQHNSSSSTKQCQFQGCLKGARGASGLCIAHGGGRRCQRHGCHKGAEGRTAFCKAHGGGRRCEYLGCTKSAEGRTDFCIAHGGGRRCSHDGCTRAARGKSGLCIRHGGGKRCQRENCKKSAEGLSGLCISHGGGRRCQYPECNKGAQGSTAFCKAHGGGKRCTYLGCKKGAEGSTPFCKGHGGGKRCSFQGGGICPKSVHGGTLFCVAHGGGKRCAIPECTKSARGRTDFCVRHGGGKRCKIEGCGKSAQGSTNFCKAHGGGKRCSWGQPGYEFGQGDSPCNLFARGKTGLCASHGALVQDKRVHGGATVGIAIEDPKANPLAKMKQQFTVEDMSVDNSISAVTSNRSWNNFGLQHAHLPVGKNPSSGKVPEGRVHGGNLMSMLACSPGFNFTRTRDVVGPSEPEKSFMTHQSWM